MTNKVGSQPSRRQPIDIAIPDLAAGSKHAIGEDQFRQLRYSAWHLPNIEYTQDGDGFVMKEMKISNLPVVEYAERVFSDIAIGLEELVMYALQGQCTGGLVIDEIPIGSRNPQNPQRFKRNLRGMGSPWEMRWSGKGFYES
jgi:hypothetical protein